MQQPSKDEDKMRDDQDDLTPAEREAFARLERTAPLDPAEEERTVQRLRAAGLLGADGSEELLGAPGTAPGAPVGTRWPRPLRDGTPWPRPLRVGLAIAAGLACFLAGLWSGRTGVFGRAAEPATREPATTQAPGASPATAIAEAPVRAPIIRF